MITILAAGALSFSSMVGLCQGIKRHHLAIWNTPLAPLSYRALRIYGVLAALLSLWLCSQYWGWAMGSVAEFGLLSMTGLILVFGLPYWPKTMVLSGIAAGVLGLGVAAVLCWQSLAG